MLYLLHEQSFLFRYPEALQRCHLLDVWHLPKAHWFTLCGVRIGTVYAKRRDFVEFDLHRFGRSQRITITQKENQTVVQMPNFQLHFSIRTYDAFSHWLDVKLFGHAKILTFLKVFIATVFYLTVMEDKLYYKNSRH